MKPLAKDSCAQIAALTPTRVPLPTAAPGRPAATGSPVPQTLDETLVAALEEEAPPAAPGQLAYAVPTPRERPPFEAVLRGEQNALPTPRMIAAADDEGLTPEAIIAAAMPDTAPALVTETRNETAPLRSPSAVSEIAAAMAKPAPAHAAEKPMVVAALERPMAPVLAAVPAAKSALPSAVPLPAAAVRRSAAAKGGRVVGDEVVRTAVRPAPRPAGTNDAAISRRIEIATLITNPERRAVETRMGRPVADTLIGNLPAAVFARGFSAKGGAPSGPQHFEGKAVNFLPVRKLD